MNYRFVLLFSTLLFSTNIIAERALILARAPQLSPSIISQQWSPFVKYLSEATGIKIILKVYTERSTFEMDIKEGKVDLYFANPGYGIAGHLKHGYIPLIRSGRKLLEGIIVVNKDSGIKNIQQLNGKIIAFPAKNAFVASLYVQSRLNSDFNINYQPKYYGLHDNAYRSVLIGNAIAASGVKRTLNAQNPKLREQLQIIYTTPGINPHPLMAHPRVSVDKQKSIQEVILTMNKNATGKKLLKIIKLQNPVIADYARDYQSIEPLVKNVYQFMLN